MVTSERARLRKGIETQPKLNVEAMVNEITKQIENGISKRSTKFQLFVNEYNKQFRTYSMDVLYDEIMQMVFKGVKGALVLYGLNLNGQVLIELTGILERYIIIYIIELFKLFPDRQLMVEKLLFKKFLDEMAKYLIILGLWDQSDEQSIVQLKKARDGIAHKNVAIVSKRLNNGKPLNFLEIDFVMSKTNTLPYIITVIKLLYKLFSRFPSKTDRSVIAQQMLDGKIKKVSEFFG